MFLGIAGYPFNNKQRLLIEHIERLTKNLVKRYNIKSTNVLAYSDISPLRKNDPSPLFFWNNLQK